MDELIRLMTELVDEVRGLRSDLSELRGPLGYTLEDVNDAISSVETNVTLIDSSLSLLADRICGPMSGSLDDVADRLGPPSVYGMDDIHRELAGIRDALDARA